MNRSPKPPPPSHNERVAALIGIAALLFLSASVRTAR
jgi:hypothetical protein